jgi:hypothetical protein
MSEPALDTVLATMLAAFQPVLPAQVPGLPQPSLSMARARPRPSGIGNIIGMTAHGSIGMVEQHAVRVDAQMRVTLWGFAAAEVDQAVTALTAQIYARRDSLAAEGFLKLVFEGSSPPEETRHPIAWRRFADYDVLFETSYEDIDGAVGLIAPIRSQEQTTATGWLQSGDFGRWDDIAAPLVTLRGPATFIALAALSYLGSPAVAPSGSVTLTRSFDGAPSPTDAGTLSAFMALAAAPAPNVFVSFATISAMLAAFAPDGAAFAMGDREGDGTPDQYVPTKLAFPAPLPLPHATDRLELAFSQPKFDRAGVVYLRAVRLGS